MKQQRTGHHTAKDWKSYSPSAFLDDPLQTQVNGDHHEWCPSPINPHSSPFLHPSILFLTPINNMQKHPFILRCDSFACPCLHFEKEQKKKLDWSLPCLKKWICFFFMFKTTQITNQPCSCFLFLVMEYKVPSFDSMQQFNLQYLFWPSKKMFLKKKDSCLKYL